MKKGIGHLLSVMHVSGDALASCNLISRRIRHSIIITGKWGEEMQVEIKGENVFSVPLYCVAFIADKATPE